MKEKKKKVKKGSSSRYKYFDRNKKL